MVVVIALLLLLLPLNCIKGSDARRSWGGRTSRRLRDGSGGSNNMLSASIEPGVLQGEYVSQWLSMTPEEALNYYTPYEVCKLYRLEERSGAFRCEEDFTKSRQHIPDACLLEGEGLASTAVQCGHNDGAKLRHISTLAWPEGYNFRSVINHMRRHGMNTIIMIGDSMTSQHASDAYCSAHRHGYSDIRMVNTSTFPDHTVRSPSFIIPTHHNQGSIEKPYFQLYSLLFERVNINSAFASTVNVLMVDPFKDLYPVIQQILSSSSIDAQKAIFVINTGLHDHDMSEYATTVMVLLRFMEIVMTKSNPDKVAEHLVFFRETSAQHFKTITGEFPWGDSSFSWSFPDSLRDEIHSNCSKLVSDQLIGDHIVSTSSASSTSGTSNTNNHHSTINKLEHQIKLNHLILKETLSSSYSCQHPQLLGEQQWKLKIAQSKLKELQYLQTQQQKQLQTQKGADSNKLQHSNNLFFQDSFKILSFWNITAGRFDAHSRIRKDCSHFCNNPMLFLPVWDALARILISNS